MPWRCVTPTLLAALLLASSAPARAAPPPPPGGPILVVTSRADPFGDYYAEILRAEGLGAFAVADVDEVTAETLSGHGVVLLASMALTDPQVALLERWVRDGGDLVAMRPDRKLAGLLGLSAAGGRLANRYLRVNTSVRPGAGITGETMQFHGEADRYALAGATSVATLYATASIATPNPAVTLRSVGAAGGQAAAFTYDLARSVAWTRQGNPAWAGRERDGEPVIRSDDMFIDWADPEKVAIPQADEQQRLLVNLVTQMQRDEMPLPRFWYFPRGERAVVVMTGDDHGNGGTIGAFQIMDSQSQPGCSLADWECVRGTSYVYPGTAITQADAATYRAKGFEIALHLWARADDDPSAPECQDFTPASLDADLTTQLAAFSSRWPQSLPAPATIRTHCVVWSDWASQAKADAAHGIRLNTDYYYFPPEWVEDRPGMFTGSGIPMRFADVDGAPIDVYQAATQLPDESTPNVAAHIQALLDRAQGPDGYYGAFTVNMHTDGEAHAGRNAVVAAALARGVPIVSARQLVQWLDGHDASAFHDLSFSGTRLRFRIAPGAGARGLEAMVPAQGPTGPLLSLTHGGRPVATATRTVKGIQYAAFPAAAGRYVASYGGIPAAPAPSSELAMAR
jgi:hypothetical protein